METRRIFLKRLLLAGGVLTMGADPFPAQTAHVPTGKAACTVYRAVNGAPDQNIIKVIEMMGGIERLIGSHDVVVMKPNAQWWNQGAPNLLALITFVEMIFEWKDGFHGEVVIAENCHRGPKPSTAEHSGWAARFDRNSDLQGIHNLNDLSSMLKKRYGQRVSDVHWIDVGAGGKRVKSPADGSGYVYCDGTNGVPLLKCDNEIDGPGRRVAIMTYPVFVTNKGTIVDFKNGVWSNGTSTEQPLKFINFSALNHHSTYCGMTSSIKNYMGITDLSGGPDPDDRGRLTGNYHNFHSFPFNKWAPGPVPGMLGKAIGVFMRTIRKADLNITTAEWVGLSSRTEPPVAHTRAVLASTDPVALDYHAAKYILFPNSRLRIHNPDDTKSPLRQYIEKCSEECSGTLDEGSVEVKSYDFEAGCIQKEDEYIVHGEKHWGKAIKPILKYLYLRYVM